jgi:hypothetical protein
MVNKKMTFARSLVIPESLMKWERENPEDTVRTEMLDEVKCPRDLELLRE